MAKASIVDKAIGLIPDVGDVKRAKRSAGPRAQLAAVQRALAKLVRDVEKLSRLVDNGRKSNAAKRTVAAKRTPVGRRSRKVRT